MEKIKNCVSQIHQFLTALKYRVSLEVKRYETHLSYVIDLAFRQRHQ